MPSAPGETDLQGQNDAGENQQPQKEPPVQPDHQPQRIDEPRQSEDRRQNAPAFVDVTENFEFKRDHFGLHSFFVLFQKTLYALHFP